ncbi:hypothetical protein BH10ACT7_BH10ACT7_14120 [soil metagenome]
MTAAPAKVHSKRDLRRAGQVFAAILMPIGPAAIAVLRFLFTDAEAGNSPGAWVVVVWLGAIGVFTLLPGAWAALQLLRRHRPVLSAWTAAFLVPGFLAMASLWFTDPLTYTAHELGYSPSEVTAFLDTVQATAPPVTVMFVVFLAGHIVGTVLLGVTALRSGLIPTWVAILLIVSQPLHLVAGMTTQPWLDLIAWGLTALGMGFLARAVLKTPVDEWELPPIR